jgi:predicted short-subunit dehydrogenase-like oxidoreductase (DUF2520 family)
MPRRSAKGEKVKAKGESLRTGLKTGKRRDGGKTPRLSVSVSRDPILPPDRGRPSVAMVGPGRLGTALLIALRERGYAVEAVVARTVASARRAAKVTGSVRAFSLGQLEELLPTDLLFITTPDDAIAKTAELLSSAFATPKSMSLGLGGEQVRPRVAIHASGALSSEALAPLRKLPGFAIASMHPLVSVSDSAAGARALRSAFYCVEGDREGVRAARHVVHDVGGRSFSIKTRDKSLYHAAAVLASGHAVALFDTAVQLLLRCGLSEGRARTVLLPLLRSTFENLSAFPAASALTGTFARADVTTVVGHLGALARVKDHETAVIYAVLGLRSLDLARQAGADPRALREIARILRKK